MKLKSNNKKFGLIYTQNLSNDLIYRRFLKDNCDDIAFVAELSNLSPFSFFALLKYLSKAAPSYVVFKIFTVGFYSLWLNLFGTNMSTFCDLKHIDYFRITAKDFPFLKKRLRLKTQQ